MIAAVAAALVGGAYADAAYDFVATLKTTKAKPGTVQYTTYYLGMDEDAPLKPFWYEDARYDQISEANKGTKTIGGRTIPSLNVVNGKLADETNTRDIDLIKALALDYSDKSAGQWCCVVKLPSDVNCYRVVGTRKIQETFYVGQCCTAKKPSTLLAYDAKGGIAGFIAAQVGDTFNGVFQLFGAQTYEKANKGEIYAQIRFLTARAWNFEGYIAGQGSFGRIIDSDGTVGAGPTTINGNIVGKMAAPQCEYCCSAPEDSVAFDCANEETPMNLPWTAGFGSFRLKYNRSLSNF